MITELISHPLMLPVTIPLGAGLLCLLVTAPTSRVADGIRSLLAVLAAAVVFWQVWQLFGTLADGPVTA